MAHIGASANARRSTGIPPLSIKTRCAGLLIEKREIKKNVNDDSSRESGLRRFFRRDEDEKSQTYFVYLKILRQNGGGKRPQDAEAGVDQRLHKYRGIAQLVERRSPKP